MQRRQKLVEWAERSNVDSRLEVEAEVSVATGDAGGRAAEDEAVASRWRFPNLLYSLQCR